MAAYMARRYAKRKAEAIKLLGGKCSCGSEFELRFHHRNPEDKSFTICDVLAGKRWSAIVEELAKCELKCEACHLTVHADRARDRAVMFSTLNRADGGSTPPAPTNSLG